MLISLMSDKYIFIAVVLAVSCAVVLFIFYGSLSVGRRRDESVSKLPDGRKPKYAKYAWYVSSQLQLKGAIAAMYYDLAERIEIKTSYPVLPDDVISMLKEDNAFSFHNSLHCNTVTDDSKVTTVTMDIEYSQFFRVLRAIHDFKLASMLSVKERGVYNKVKTITRKLIEAKMSVYEKELAIHDYIIKETRYDEEGYNKNAIPKESYTPYGLLFKKKGVCQAYSELFALFMTHIGVECCIVIGSASDIIGKKPHNYKDHAWNMVYIDGQFYHVDVTFDNPVPKIQGRICHKYFNLSDEQMKKDHTWDMQLYRKCTSQDMNYKGNDEE